MTDQLGLGLTEKPKLVTHQISKWLHVINQGVLRDGESWGSQITSERAVQLFPLIVELGNRNGWDRQQWDPNKERFIICCRCRPEEYITAISHLKWMRVCREEMVRMMEESDLTELKREKQSWPMTVRHAVSAVENLEKWLYENKEWIK